jgi:hypothetical protein
VALLQPFLPEGVVLLVFLGGLAGLLGLLWAPSQRFPPDQAAGSEWLLRQVKAPWAKAGEAAEGGLGPQGPPSRTSASAPPIPRISAWVAVGRRRSQATEQPVRLPQSRRWRS